MRKGQKEVKEERRNKNREKDGALQGTDENRAR